MEGDRTRIKMELNHTHTHTIHNSHSVCGLHDLLNVSPLVSNESAVMLGGYLQIEEHHRHGVSIPREVLYDFTDG